MPGNGGGAEKIPREASTWAFINAPPFLVDTHRPGWVPGPTGPARCILGNPLESTHMPEQGKIPKPPQFQFRGAVLQLMRD